MTKRKDISRGVAAGKARRSFSKAARRNAIAALLILLILCGAAGAAASASASAPSHRAAVHPPAVKAAAGSALKRCPSSAGLERFTSKDVRAAVAVASRYGDTSRAAELATSDRAWWPQVEKAWAHGRKASPEHEAVVGHHRLAGDGASSSIIARACGSSLVPLTEVVAVGPSPNTEHCDACISTLFFVDRRRHPLVYFVY